MSHDSFQPGDADIAARIQVGLDRGVRLAAEHILGESNRAVPIEEGTLQRSGKVTVEDGKAAISYDTPYAVKQHEDLTMHHDEGRHAKFLEQAANANRTQAAHIIAHAIRSELS